MADDVGGLKVASEATVLTKFDGDPEQGRIVERITIVDGEIVAVEHVDTEETTWA